MKKTILIMCSGGDAPGMNACVYYLTKFLEETYKVVGVIGGFDGLIKGEFTPLSSEILKPHLTLGGSYIRAGRSLKFLTEEGRLSASQNYEKQKAEYIVVLGGNGSFKACLNAKLYGIKTIAIPATIDNDLFYSDFSLGFDSARDANIHYIKNVQACCHAQNKIPLVEVMGRDSGKLALAAAVSVGAEILAVPEVPQNEDDIIIKIKELLKQEKKDFLIIVTEYLFEVDNLAGKISDECKVDCKAFKSGYFQRGEGASGDDVELGAKFAEFTASLIKKDEYNLAVGIKNDRAFAAAISEALKAPNNFDTRYYNKMF